VALEGQKGAGGDGVALWYFIGVKFKEVWCVLCAVDLLRLVLDSIY
jgi:hypothetical protein